MKAEDQICSKGDGEGEGVGGGMAEAVGRGEGERADDWGGEGKSNGVEREGAMAGRRG